MSKGIVLAVFKNMEKTKKEKLIEIARSFSQKLNMGNYQTADFFTSAKMEVPESEAKETSEKLFRFCQEETEISARNYQLDNMPTPKPTLEDKQKSEWLGQEEVRQEKDELKQWEEHNKGLEP